MYGDKSSSICEETGDESGKKSSSYLKQRKLSYKNKI